MHNKYYFECASSQDLCMFQKDDNNHRYYQICQYKNPQTGKYHVRRFLIDPDGNYLSVKDKLLSKDQVKYFIGNKNNYEYRIYSSYDLETLPAPRPGDILMAQSSLLNNSHSYTGYAKF